MSVFKATTFCIPTQLQLHIKILKKKKKIQKNINIIVFLLEQFFTKITFAALCQTNVEHPLMSDETKLVTD